MRILVLSPIMPYPPDDGDSIRIYNVMKQLSKKHDLHLVCFCAPGEKAGNKLSKIFRSVVALPLTRGQIAWNVFRALFSGRPMNVAAYDSGAMRDAVDSELLKLAPDLIYTYRLRMAPYAWGKKTPKVIDIVDSMALVNTRRMRYEKNPARLAYGLLDTGRILSYERSLPREFGAIFINSEDDADFLGTGRTVVAANGSDGALRGKKGKKAGFTAGFFGNMDYPPNMDAVLFFLKNVWKKLRASDKNISLVIAGDTGGRLAKYSGQGVTVKPYVDDIDAEISGWDVSVVPVRYGAGRQNKIMKSWSCGVPVVSTPFAAKGVYGADKKNMLIAQCAGCFAERILELKASPALRARLVAGGKKTVRERFDWARNVKIIDREIRKAVNTK